MRVGGGAGWGGVGGGGGGATYLCCAQRLAVAWPGPFSPATTLAHPTPSPQPAVLCFMVRHGLTAGCSHPLAPPLPPQVQYQFATSTDAIVFVSTVAPSNGVYHPMRLLLILELDLGCGSYVEVLGPRVGGRFRSF